MEKPRRKSIRYQGFDYAEEGGYFVMIVTKDREKLFGEIVNGEMVLSDFGKIIELSWKDLVNHNDDIELDEFVIMPNHFHGIVLIVGEGSEPSPTGISGAGEPTSMRNLKRHSLTEIVRQFKTFSARRINQLRNTRGITIWQRSFYDHIIRGQKDYDNIRNYIAMNPLKWEIDEENTE